MTESAGDGFVDYLIESGLAIGSHIMLDLETWGKDPGCDLRSVGAVVFDPHAGTVGCKARWDEDHVADEEIRHIYHRTGDGKNPYLFYTATDNPKGFRGRFDRWFNKPDGWQTKYKLDRDPDTVAWWAEQSEEAQGAFDNPVDLKNALQRFGHWLAGVGGYEYEPDNPKFRAPNRVNLWAHGPQFDVAILAAAYRAVDLPTPWHYRAPRDTRTAFDMAGIADHSDWLKRHPGPLRIEHHALDDAICQARAVCGAYHLNRYAHGGVVESTTYRLGENA